MTNVESGELKIRRDISIFNFRSATYGTGTKIDGTHMLL
jgi:hypothetical protein